MWTPLVCDRKELGVVQTSVVACGIRNAVGGIRGVCCQWLFIQTFVLTSLFHFKNIYQNI